ncbi:SMI1/KNR4 family protein [Photobacterium damselae subsp. damselae]
MNIERLNINVGGVRSPGFSGEAAAFVELEKILGCKVPEEYVEFLISVNGGHPEIGCFSILDDDSQDNLFEIDSFYSITHHSTDNVKDVLISWKEALGAKSLPIGSDGGGNQIYLNLEDKPSSVWIYLHDEGKVRLKIANCFTEFLDSLIINPDFI